MIKKGSRVMIIGVGKDSWLHEKRKALLGITGKVNCIGERFKGGVFNCNIILDKPIFIDRLLGGQLLKLKEVK